MRVSGVVRGVWVGVVAACLCVAAQGQQAAKAGEAVRLTADEVINRLRTRMGVAVPADTVDTFKAGDPATPVTGIVTTFTPTMTVLRRAVADHANLVLTHEPSFYNHRDEATRFANDPVYLEKMAYIREHHLVLFRVHDALHLLQPDEIVETWVKRAGWESYRKPGEQMYFTLPATTLAGLAQQLQSRFKARVIRVVGDPEMRVSHVAYRPGASGEEKHVRSLERDDVEVLVAGEASEWETVEYVRDAMLQGRHKGLILLGHDTSEEVGMESFAEWVRGVVPGVKVEFVPAGEPYWLPGEPVGAR